MIKGILIINNHGKPRLVKFYQSVESEALQQTVIRRVYQQVCQRPDSFCNYLEGIVPEWGDHIKLIYRHYATLFFVFAVDSQESDLGILDLIQVFVERCVHLLCTYTVFLFNVPSLLPEVGCPYCGNLCFTSFFSTKIFLLSVFLTVWTSALKMSASLTLFSIPIAFTTV